MNEAQATKALKTVGLAVESETRYYSNIVGANVVMAVNPAPGTRLRRGTPVTLTISRGSPPS